MTHLSTFATPTSARRVLAGVLVLAGAGLVAPAAHALELRDSPNLTYSNQDNLVIENLRIDDQGSGRCAIDVSSANNVTIRNLDIRHKNIAICAYEVQNLKIENVRMLSTSAPARGPHCKSGVSECGTSRSNWVSSPDTRLAIKLDRTPGAQLKNISATRASSGVMVHNSADVDIDRITCEDIRGPMPRGQCVIFVRSHNGTLSNFYSKGYFEQSFAEDNVNMYDSDGVTVSEGLIDGNWSINGVGVIADQGSDNTTVRNVDVMNTGVAAVSVYSNDLSIVGRNFTAENVRAKNTHCNARYGGEPSSRGLVYVSHPNAVNSRFINAQYFNHCRSSVNWCMPGSSCRQEHSGYADIREEDFTPRAPLVLSFPWEDGSQAAPVAAPAEPEPAAPEPEEPKAPVITDIRVQ